MKKEIWLIALFTCGCVVDTDTVDVPESQLMQAPSPFGDIDNIDIVAERNDGGLTLVVVVSAPIDNSPVTLEGLEAKIRNYIAAAGSEEFKGRYGYENGAPLEILVVSEEHYVDAQALEVVHRLKPVAEAHDATLEFRRSIE